MKPDLKPQTKPEIKAVPQPEPISEKTESKPINQVAKPGMTQLIDPEINSTVRENGKSETKLSSKSSSETKQKSEVKEEITTTELKPVIKPVNLGSLVAKTENTTVPESRPVRNQDPENDPVADFRAIQEEDDKWIRQLKQKNEKIQARAIQTL